MSQETTAGEKALFLMLGAAMGAAVALLFAPRTGEETRKLIMNKAREGADVVTAQTRSVAGKTTEYIDRGKEVATEYIDRGKGIVQQQRDSLNAALEAGKKAYREEKEKA